jgi:RimJ/RimL family protein N-acetyltransferase
LSIVGQVKLVEAWPLFGLRLLTPRLELRLVRDDDIPALIDAARAGIHPEDVMPFGVPWTDAEPDELRRSFAQHQWRLRMSVQPDNWSLNLAVLHDGQPIGVQDLTAHDFGQLRTVMSGSWLTQDFQGRGFGTEMRQAVLAFAFDHLHAEVAESSAAAWNLASLSVSRKLGYTDNGVTRVAPRRGVVVDEQRVRLVRARFIRPSWVLQVQGLEAARRDLTTD